MNFQPTATITQPDGPLRGLGLRRFDLLAPPVSPSRVQLRTDGLDAVAPRSNGAVLGGPGHETVVRWREGERFEQLFEHRCDWLRENGRGDQLAVDAGDVVLSYDQLDARANQLARYLLEWGVRAGDRVGLLFDAAVHGYVTLGVPLPTYATVILDPVQDKVALHFGDIGEIGIAWIGVARGYLNRDDLTARAFIPDFLGIDNSPSGRIYRTGDLGRVNDDGEIEYHGRIDTQVKIRGYRIELAEIESVLLRVPGIAQAVVDTYQPTPGVLELAAYYSPRRDTAGTPRVSIRRRSTSGLASGCPATWSRPTSKNLPAYRCSPATRPTTRTSLRPRPGASSTSTTSSTPRERRVGQRVWRPSTRASAILPASRWEVYGIQPRDRMYLTWSTTAPTSFYYHQRLRPKGDPFRAISAENPPCSPCRTPTLIPIEELVQCPPS